MVRGCSHYLPIFCNVIHLVGIIGIACPDKSPLLSFVSLMGAAIARSNSVVVVPSEKYPLLALDLYQVKRISKCKANILNCVIDSRSLKPVIFLEVLSTFSPAPEIMFLSILLSIKMLMQCGILDLRRDPSLWSTPQQVQ